jgi:hypothetical protein
MWEGTDDGFARAHPLKQDAKILIHTTLKLCWGKPWAQLRLKHDMIVEDGSCATSQSHLGPLGRLGRMDGVRLYCFGALLN